MKHRSLADGAKQSAQLSEQEQEFISRARSKGPAGTETEIQHTPQPPGAPAVPVTQTILPQMTSRINIGARCRPEIALTVKKVSLERQMTGREPYTMQDIIEEALQQWLTLNGYL
ncbi:MAG: hypothetical protein KDA89_00515 [Planctomycetaceae bacterium]|nr:hypothetical protein [Planctomycetaceae bacterium]